METSEYKHGTIRHWEVDITSGIATERQTVPSFPNFESGPIVLNITAKAAKSISCLSLSQKQLFGSIYLYSLFMAPVEIEISPSDYARPAFLP
jgi:hypothetical protein